MPSLSLSSPLSRPCSTNACWAWMLLVVLVLAPVLVLQCCGSCVHLLSRPGPGQPPTSLATAGYCWLPLAGPQILFQRPELRRGAAVLPELPSTMTLEALAFFWLRCSKWPADTHPNMGVLPYQH
jgi:hypothetical protein